MTSSQYLHLTHYVTHHILPTPLLLGAVNTTPLLDKDKGAKLGSISGSSGGASSSGISNIGPVVGSGGDSGSNSHVHTNDHGGSKGSGSGSNGVGSNSGSTSTLQGIVGRLDQIKISVSPAVSAVLGTFPYKF